MLWTLILLSHRGIPKPEFRPAGTVSRFLFPEGRRSFLWAGHLCPAQATYPGVERSGQLLLPYLVLLRMGFALPARITPAAVRSYRTFSPLPGARAKTRAPGGIFSVALSVKPALSEPPRPLAGMLPYGDRTFLPAAGRNPPARRPPVPAGLRPFSQNFADTVTVRSESTE
jgi:hypothetical protein